MNKIRKVAKVRKVAAVAAAPEIPAPTWGAAQRTRWPWPPEESERAKLEAKAGPGLIGTLPERILEWHLIQRRHSYDKEQALMGGRWEPGGALADFIVYDLAPVPAVLRVLGQYWHGPQFPTRRARDDAQAGRLREAGYLVADLWEGDLYAAALAGRLEAWIWERLFR